MLILAHTAVLKTVVYKKVSLSSPGALLIAHKGKYCGGHPDSRPPCKLGVPLYCWLSGVTRREESLVPKIIKQENPVLST